VDWHRLHAALHHVCERRSTESERVLREILAFEGDLILDESRGVPHAMPAADVMRSVAMSTLARWDLRTHRRAIADLGRSTRSHMLAELARVALAPRKPAQRPKRS